MPEAVVEPDVEGCAMIVMENHGCEPVVLEEGYVLGELQDVKCNEASDGEGRQGVVSAVIMGDDFGEERLQHLKEKVKFDPSNLADRLNDLVKYAIVFALHSSELGMTDLVTHAIDTGDSVPIKQAARRILFSLRKTVDNMVQNMLEQGVIKPSSSHWSSPVVLMEKKDGNKRFCVDYRRLNSVTKMDVFPLPRVDGTLDSLAQSQYFTSLDLATGFWQVQMDASSQEKTVFATYSGLYEFRVMPFGLCNSPATFQRLMESVLSGLTQKICMVYIDDVLVIGKIFTEHLDNLRKCFPGCELLV